MIIFRTLSVCDKPIFIDKNQLYLIGNDLVVPDPDDHGPCDRCPISIHENEYDLEETNCGLYGPRCSDALENAFNGMYRNYANKTIVIKDMTLYESVYFKYMNLNELETYGEI